MFQLRSVPGKLLPHSCGYVLLNLKTKCLCIYVSNNDSRWQSMFKEQPGGVCVSSWSSAQAASLCLGTVCLSQRVVPKASALGQAELTWCLMVCELSAYQGRRVNGADAPTSQMTLSSPARRTC